MAAPVERDQGSEPVLPVGYYLENFEAILSAVEARYGDLLIAAEREFLADFAQLSLPARRLYTRLVSRKGPFFRRDRLHYDEITDLGEATDELLAGGFLSVPIEAPLDQLLQLCLKAELIELLESFHNQTGLEVLSGAVREKRSRLLERLSSCVGGQFESTLRETLFDRFGIVEFEGREPILVFRLLFFGNLGQDWKEFVLRDTGLVKYEPYPLAPLEERRFHSRIEVEEGLLLRQARSALGELFRNRDYDQVVALGSELIGDTGVWHPKSRRYLDQIIYRTGRAFERLEQRERALAVFRLGSSSACRRRKLRLLELCGRHDEALELCARMSTDHRDELELSAATITQARLTKTPRARGSAIPTREIAVVRNPEVSVESSALAALAERGDIAVGFFSENWLWNSLFGLAFWEIIFAPVPGVFQHEFQFGPSDLYRSEFRSARREPIDARLIELRGLTPGVELRNALMTTYEHKQGTANRFVAWDSALRRNIELALDLVDGSKLAAVCDRLSLDLKRYRRGFPDLFVAGTDGSDFQLIEVKAPGDQLRPEQKTWIRYLNDNGIESSVLRIKWK